MTLRKCSFALALMLVTAEGAEKQSADDAEGTRADLLAQTLASARAEVERDVPLLREARLQAEAWGRLGMLYHAQSLLDEAEQAYRKALAISKEVPWHYLLAVVLNARGEVDPAIAEYHNALVAADGDHPQSSYRLGLALLIKGDRAGADDALRVARDAMPDSAAVLAAQADVALTRNDLELAKARLMRAIEIEPAAGRLAYKLSQVYRRLGEREAASQWLERRNEFGPTVVDPLLLEVASLSMSPEFFMKAGERAWQRGDQEQALAAWRNAVALAPQDVEAGLVLAHALGELGAPEAGLVEVRRVLALDSESASGWYLLAFLQRDAEDPSAALVAANRSMALQASPATRALRAALRMRAGHYAEAAADYAVLLGEAGDAYVNYWTGMARLGAGNCRAARPVLAAAVALQPAWGQAHIAMTRADATCGDEPARITARRRAAELVASNDNAETRITLAIAELGNGNVDAARVAVARMEVGDWLADAIERGEAPQPPFPAGSDWWLPAEARR